MNHPPIRIKRSGWNRFFPATEGQVALAVEAAGIEARGKRWVSIDALMNFIADAVQEQIGGVVRVVLVAEDIDSGLPVLAVQCGARAPRHLSIAATEVRVREAMPLVSEQTRQALERAQKANQQNAQAAQTAPLVKPTPPKR